MANPTRGCRFCSVTRQVDCRLILWRAINLGHRTTGAYLRFEILDQLINPFTGALVEVYPIV